MSTLNEHITIPRDIKSKDDLDFDFLRQEGIRHIQELGSKLWTDYNVHDPGITMLEVLSYAITDLGNRINLPIEDLMTRKDVGLEGQFYQVAEILPSAPTSASDYRKLMIDIEGVKNAWLKKEEITLYADLKNEKLSYVPIADPNVKTHQKTSFTLKGLYRFLVETDNADKELPEALKTQIFKAFHAHRNLCEELIAVEAVETVPISVCANIEVIPEADEELIHAQITVALEDYLAPSPRFYSLKEMIDKGYGTAEIFEGPVLSHGFLDPKELDASKLRREVRLSDIINIIMDIKGVEVVKDITLGHCDENDGKGDTPWVICVPENKKPKLCSKTTLNFFKGILPVNVNKAQAKEYKQNILKARHDKDLLAGKDKFPEIPKGNYGAWGAYSSIQHDFPETYGLSDNGLPHQLGMPRRALAKQLKGYLLFFDQILASYFKHLEKVSDLLSMDQSPRMTYFTQAVNDIKDVKELFKDDSILEDEARLSKSLMGILDDPITRRNELMDHLMARFAENFGNYAFLMKLLYGKSTDEIVLQNKLEFLKDYEEISKNRGDAFNYYDQPASALWDTFNVSGAQKRIARLVGIKEYKRRNLSDAPVEIYKYTNTDGEEVYRWRIRNESGNILLSSTTDYPSYNKAGQEMYFTILKVIETDKEKIQHLLDPEHKLYQLFDTSIQVEAFHFHKAESSDKYSFDVINPAIESESSPDYIIAKQYHYHKDKEAAVKAVLELIDFLKYKFTEEGIFLVEHILLRPSADDAEHFDQWESDGKTFTKGEFLPFCSDDYDSCKLIDPYSFRVSIILPGFTYRFANKDFRNYLENVIREELPAHIVAKICWIGYREGEEPEIHQEDVENPEDATYKENQLVRFEKAYKEFLYELTDIHKRKDNITSMNKYNGTLNEMIASLTGLHTIYPTGRLYDCTDENEDLDGKLILGKTNLGTL
ncbi:hypothetical protein FKX85_15745 [Echinicola soli]|uniref:Uncharacterized protein n=1 Tax=Echinicola soli TaxID=2591634 RepID=A0A514CL50_9BACT|nr:hypothetical protein [Echinicola soli]QDH80414.1 hypothetical protein FKX85_15745 [Echinicola soli]